MTELHCDYLVIGSGAVGMAFVDTMLSESDASFLIVDNHHQPGGHWNDAYPFVRLHQPSHFYGVASTPLGSKTIDQTGPNAGFYELAGVAEVQSYFEQLMRQRFLPSGRVQYLPMCEAQFDGTVRNLLSGEVTTVDVRQRIVDSTFFHTSVPSRHRRSFAEAPGVRCIAPNALPIEAPSAQSFCVLGAGKTAMDTLVWLLNNGVAEDDIAWVCPRRSWMINRKVTQASVEFFRSSIGGFAGQLQALAEGTSPEDIFDRLEASGFMIRVDPTQRPTMFHYATISEGEVAQLQRIERIIEGRRVQSIEREGLQMTDGSTEALPADTLYVDCTASAVDFKNPPMRPAFEDQRITIQAVRVPNPCLSAAVTAYVEAHYEDDVTRNRLCNPVPLPDDERGFLRSTLGNMMNQVTWSAEPELSAFVTNCRLDGFGAVIRDADTTDPENQAILEKMGRFAQPAAENLMRLLSG
ncbi:MAG: NAD(P)/FAD-dependent oxidoreductase [Pseudomonadota bacterium]